MWFLFFLVRHFKILESQRSGFSVSNVNSFFWILGTLKNTMAFQETFFEYRDKFNERLSECRHALFSFQSWKKGWKAMSDYYFSPARVVIVRIVRSKNHQEFLKHLEIVSQNMYSVQGHISSHIFISENQDYEVPDPCGIGTITVKTSRFFLLSRWKSRSAWDAYQKCHDLQLAKSLFGDSLIMHEDVIVTNSFCKGIADHRFVRSRSESKTIRKKPLNMLWFVGVPGVLMLTCFLALLWVSYFEERFHYS